MSITMDIMLFVVQITLTYATNITNNCFKCTLLFDWLCTSGSSTSTIYYATDSRPLLNANEQVVPDEFS